MKIPYGLLAAILLIITFEFSILSMEENFYLAIFNLVLNSRLNER